MIHSYYLFSTGFQILALKKLLVVKNLFNIGTSISSVIFLLNFFHAVGFISINPILQKIPKRRIAWSNVWWPRWPRYVFGQCSSRLAKSIKAMISHKVSAMRRGASFSWNIMFRCRFSNCETVKLSNVSTNMFPLIILLTKKGRSISLRDKPYPYP